jgi:UDP-glucuronate 4-epimerase
MQVILVTGAAGFIGFHVANRLLKEGYVIHGIDNLNSYYDVQLKKKRLDILKQYPNFHFQKIDLADREAMHHLFSETHFDGVVHLAAQAGVRYSIDHPFAYCDSNLTGFLTILEGCRSAQIKHLIYASSSSVYGENKKVPFSVDDNVDHPISLYAATKKANELMAHTYSHLYQIHTVGLRFFTVYGPWGRPDMAYFKFVDAIANDRPIQVFNHGKMKRDFTYIDDVVEGIFRLVKRFPGAQDQSDTSSGETLYKVYNIGNHQPVELSYFIEVIESAMGKSAEKIMMPMQPGDVPATYADIEELMKDVGFQPSTLIEEGIQQFVDWYKTYFQTAVS